MKSIIISSLLAISICSFGQTRNCKPLDFLQLKDSSLQAQLFIKIDSILKVQYPNNDKERIAIDLNESKLNEFLKSINKDSLRLNKTFTHKLHFNIDLFQNQDTLCIDDIILDFKENCYFILTLSNYIPTDSNPNEAWCSGNAVIYSFQIKNKVVKNFGRNQAG
tara:strand:+ start:104 stop:595 length:492 start_codon:yes stop_codon:yes gene_type:complete